MNRELNSKLVSKVLGWLLLTQAVFLVFPIITALIYSEFETISYFVITIAVYLFIGSLGVLLGRKASSDVGKREGAIIVTTTWVLHSIVGALPYRLSGYVPDFTDAFFETLSGFTTTGITILTNIESLPHSLLLWRSMTHWIGGLGIIVIFLAILPLIGGTGYQLFNSESTTPMREKFAPRINDTAKMLFTIYLIITTICTIALYVAGMDAFDSINHAFSIIATGGFSTKQASIAYYNSPAIEYVTIFFMFFSGVNFILYYFLYKMNIRKLSNNDELKYYALILLGAAFLIFISHIELSTIGNLKELEKSFRDSLFVTTSCITTTGLATVDYMTWKSYTWVILLLLMISGASTYSTSGGLKISRVVILFKFSYYEFKKLVHPNAVVAVRYNGQLVKDDLLMRILAYTMIYLLIIIFGSLFLNITGLGFIESLSGMVTCLSDAGLGLGQLGPTHSFAEIPVVSKWFLTFVMLLGRLEIYSVLLLFTPVFWKK